MRPVGSRETHQILRDLVPRDLVTSLLAYDTEHCMVYNQGSKLTFLLGSTGAPNFKKLGAPQMFYEHPLNIKEQQQPPIERKGGQHPSWWLKASSIEPDP